MSVQLAAEIWNLINDLIPYQDREQYADGLVNILLDQGFDITEIKDQFSNDTDVKSALKYYADEEADDEQAEFMDEDSDDNDW